MEHIGETIKLLRKRQNITQKILSAETGVDRSLISKIEKGKTAGSIQTIKKLAIALGVRISEILDDLEH